MHRKAKKILMKSNKKPNKNPDDNVDKVTAQNIFMIHHGADSI